MCNGLDGSFSETLKIPEGVTFDGGEFTISIELPYTLNNDGTIVGGTFDCQVNNNGTITGGTFNADVWNYATIEGGTFTEDVWNDGTIVGGTFDTIRIEGGSISGNVKITSYLDFGNNFYGSDFIDLSNADLGDGISLLYNSEVRDEIPVYNDVLTLPDGYCVFMHPYTYTETINSETQSYMIRKHSHTLDGYGYDGDNHWKTCDCGYADKTTVAAHKVTEWTYDDTKHEGSCDDCGATLGGDHSGGEATCIAQAVCETCGASHGELAANNHTRDTYTNGFRDCCDAYQPATDSDGDGYYEIGNAGQLYWFAALVNKNCSAGFKGKLIDDVTVNENVLNDDGTLNGDGSNFRPWIPIGYDLIGNVFLASFDGNGKTVSGLYFNDSSTPACIGLLGFVDDGTIENVGVVDSYLCGGNFVGGVVGLSSNTVENCYSEATVIGSGYCVGGVVGRNDDTVTNCYNIGIVSGNDGVGGVVGNNSWGTVTNCYNIGTVSGNSEVGGVIGYNDGTVENSYGTVTNCYNIGTVSGDYNVGGVIGYNDGGTVTNCYNIGTVSGNDYVGGVVGYNDGTVENSYSTGTVSGNSNVGGVVGYNYKGTVTNCYFNTDSYNGNAIGENYGDVTVDTLTGGKTAEEFASADMATLLNGTQTDAPWEYIEGNVAPTLKVFKEDET